MTSALPLKESTEVVLQTYFHSYKGQDECISEVEMTSKQDICSVVSFWLNQGVKHAAPG